MDGRLNPGETRAVRVAGGGVFLDKVQFGDFLDQERVSEIVTHAQCGAARVRFDHVSPDKLDQYVTDWGCARAKQFSIKHRHIHSPTVQSVQYEERVFRCPPNFHPEVTIYVDATGGAFYRTSELPIGYVVNAKNLLSTAHKTNSTERNELRLCMDITLGTNGFGRWFTANAPMYVICIADSTAMLDEMTHAVNATIAQLPRGSEKFKAENVLASLPKIALAKTA
jgi:hypothetical protein